MKKIHQLVLTVVFLVISYCAVAQNLQTTIKIQAMDMAKALVKNDFDTYSKYLHPSIIQMAGGKEKLRKMTDSAAITMKTFGIQFKKILVGDPGPVVELRDQLQCVVPQATDMQTPMGAMHVETSLIAISTDKGQHWYFVDTNIYNGDKLKKALPDLSPQLIIPPQKKPVFTPSAQ